MQKLNKYGLQVKRVVSKELNIGDTVVGGGDDKEPIVLTPEEFELLRGVVDKISTLHKNATDKGFEGSETDWIQSVAVDNAKLNQENIFSNNNIFAGLVNFTNNVQFFENKIPFIGMIAMAMGVPISAALSETSDEYLSHISNPTSGAKWCIFMPFVKQFTYSERINNGAFSGDCYVILPNLMNPCHSKNIHAITFGENKNNTCIVNPYRCNKVVMLFVGTSTGTLINWGHNAFSTAPDIWIDAPNMTSVTYGHLISNNLKTIGNLRIRAPKLESNFILKIGAIKKEDVVFLLDNLPNLKGKYKRTASISCDPSLENDEEFLSYVSSFYDVDTDTGWSVGLTYQQNEQFVDETSSVTYDLRNKTNNSIYAKLLNGVNGNYVDENGNRCDLLTAKWIADDNEWKYFENENDAITHFNLQYNPPKDEMPSIEN